VAVARVVRDEVEEDADPPRVGFRDQAVEVCQRAVVGVDVAVVGDVVAPVGVRRRVDRVQPDAVDAEPREVVELVDQAGEIADAVAVRVGERADVDVIQDAFAPPRVSRRQFGHVERAIIRRQKSQRGGCHGRTTR
jgi:hypothetical protein